MAVYVASAIE